MATTSSNPLDPLQASNPFGTTPLLKIERPEDVIAESEPYLQDVDNVMGTDEVKFAMEHSEGTPVTDLTSLDSVIDRSRNEGFWLSPTALVEAEHLQRVISNSNIIKGEFGGARNLVNDLNDALKVIIEYHKNGSVDHHKMEHIRYVVHSFPESDAPPDVYGANVRASHFNKKIREWAAKNKGAQIAPTAPTPSISISGSGGSGTQLGAPHLSRW
jgi:hypothetical protein